MNRECEVCGNTGHYEEDHEVYCMYEGDFRTPESMTKVMFDEAESLGIVSKEDEIYKDILEAEKDPDYEWWHEIQDDIMTRINELEGYISVWHEGTWFIHEHLRGGVKDEGL